MRHFHQATLGLLLLTSACASDDDTSQETQPATSDTDASVENEPTTLAEELDGERLFAVRFELRAGDQEFGCGLPANLGTAATEVEPYDARMYIHNVALVRASGEQVPLTLSEETSYQRDNIALIDFVDDTGLCFTGHPELNKAVYGYAPPHADYTGVAFTLGVPAEHNHFDGAEAPAPFNASGMWWSWSGGYKYLRLDLTSAEQPIWYFHAGAAGCSGTTVSGFSCAAQQLATIELQGFDSASTAVVFDVAELYRHLDLTQADGLPGCMGGQTDSECAPLYNALGVVPWDDDAARPEQTTFRLTPADAWQPPNRSGTPATNDPALWPDPDFERSAALDQTNISKAGEARSHSIGDPRHGSNCMRCHQAQGPGVGRFSAAGTLLAADGTPASDVTVEIVRATPDWTTRELADITRLALLKSKSTSN